MQRTLNFTGRKKIPRTAAEVSLRQVDGAVSFDAELKIGNMGFPPSAEVFVEAYFKAAFMRFPWGTVGQPSVPANRVLRKIDQPGLARFRVKVVDRSEGALGRIPGVADHMEPEGTIAGKKKRTSLFRVNYSNDLKEEIWRLNLDDPDAGGPILELNGRIESIKDLARNEVFMALVYPDVVRRILLRILEDGAAEDEGYEGWAAKWTTFGETLAKRALPFDSGDEITQEQKEWLDDAVMSFSRRNKLVQNFKKGIG